MDAATLAARADKPTITDSQGRKVTEVMADDTDTLQVMFGRLGKRD